MEKIPIPIEQAILECAEHIESFDNAGTYASYFPKHCQFVLKSKYKARRDGILYYSRGHGWRVRKNPHWRDVFNKRFGDRTEKITNPHFQKIVNDEVK